MNANHVEDYIDLETCSKGGGFPSNARRFVVRIDDQRIKLDDPKVTGQQLLRHAGKRPVDEYLIFQILHGGGFEEIQLAETVDLRKQGVERFLTFESSASYRFVVDGERIEWGAKLITGLKLKQIAGVDPEVFALWREIRGGDDEPVQNEDFIDLSEDGLERFFTVIEKTTAGEPDSILPMADRKYLADQKLNFVEVAEAAQHGIIFRSYSIPEGNLDSATADVLILLPTGYPDIPPDMFYCEPWLRLTPHSGLPNCADVSFAFAGKSWQRWSRHNNQWRSGKDGIWTMLKRVDCALSEAA
ncbi:MAG: multiubiquitin domain-containing protein [Rhizobiaceae bacterium]